MQIIPVLDLREGGAVAALRGERSAYRPLSSPLAKGGAPKDVVAGFLSLHPFDALYVADIDAIEGRGGNRDLIVDLAATFPGLRIWVDAGLRDASDVRAWLAFPWADPVLGSESLSGGAVLREFAREPRLLLSLDFRGEEFLGPSDILDDASLWPGRAIVMTLARIGAGIGPDVARMRGVVERAGDRRVFAAGGLRDAADLATLQAAGAAGALVATALHQGSLSFAEASRRQSEPEARGP